METNFADIFLSRNFIDDVCEKCGANMKIVEGLRRFMDRAICDQCSDKEQVEEERKKEEERLSKEQQKELEEQQEYEKYISNGNAEQWETLATEIGVGKRHKSCTIESFIGDASEVSYWAKNVKTENLLIQSVKSGNGKTHLAVGAVKAYNLANYEAGMRKINAKFTTFSELMMTVRSSFDKDGYTEEHYKNALVKADVLVIDDLGAEKVTEYALSFLYIIINGRYENMKPTIVTTNLTSEEVISNYGMRIMSRIASGTIVKLGGIDHRLNSNKPKASV
jgi:DNA replication protein DnaC